MRRRSRAHRATGCARRATRSSSRSGIALENFDAVGAWRTLGRRAGPIDASARAGDGTKLDGVGEPARGARRVRISSCGSSPRKLLTYALGRGVEDRGHADRCGRSCASRRRASTVLVDRAGIVKSDAFQMNQKARRASSNSGTSSGAVSERDSTMFMTKKHISPPDRSAWRGRDARAAAPRSDGAGRDGAGANGASPKPRFVGCFVPHGMAPGYWIPRTEGALESELPFNFKSLEPYRDSHGDSERLAFAIGGTSSGCHRCRPLGGRRVPVREQTQEDGRADVYVGTTIDQMIAQKIGQDT
jgi:hypothetical protein